MMMQQALSTLIAFATTLALANAAAATDSAPRLWTNPATGLTTPLPKEWVIMPAGTVEGQIAETSYMHAFVNIKTAISASYSCNDGFIAKDMTDYLAKHADSENVDWEGPFSQLTGEDQGLWRITGRMKSNGLRATAFTKQIGTIYCAVNYVELREQAVPTADDMDMVSALFGTAKGTNGLVNLETGAPVELPPDWKFQPEEIILSETLKFGMFTHLASLAIAQYGCEDKPDLASVDDFKATAMGYVPAITWDEDLLHQYGEDMLTVSGRVTMDEGEIRAIAMLLVKIGSQFCSLTYRSSDLGPERGNFDGLAQAIFGPEVTAIAWGKEDAIVPKPKSKHLTRPVN